MEIKKELLDELLKDYQKPASSGKSVASRGRSARQRREKPTQLAAGGFDWNSSRF